jgi:hypothetical protein
MSAGNEQDTLNGAFLASADNTTAVDVFNNSGAWATEYLYNLGGGGEGDIATLAPVLRASGRAGDCLLNGAGDSICSGAHKTAVPVDGGARKVAMYAMHAAENWFEDFGSAQLDTGVAVVHIDPTFAETVNGQMDYHVFLTPQGDCEGLYVTRKTPTSFEVHELRGGKANVAFDYRITARRAGHETERMADETKEMRRDPRVGHAADALNARTQSDQ